MEICLKRKSPPFPAGFWCLLIVKIFVLGRPGSDLLFQALRLSTIGAEDFNGRVRDGIGWKLLANTTRSAKDENEASVLVFHPLLPAKEANGHWK